MGLICESAIYTMLSPMVCSDWSTLEAGGVICESANLTPVETMAKEYACASIEYFDGFSLLTAVVHFEYISKNR